jgi:hypothetical protein
MLLPQIGATLVNWDEYARCANMDGHPHWRGQDCGDQARAGAQPRRGFVLFAMALTVALGAMVMVIAASSVQAMSYSAALHAKSDDWVGLAAIGSLVVCVLLGALIVRRYVTARHRHR